jgi:hypothetical protein
MEKGLGVIPPSTPSLRYDLLSRVVKEKTRLLLFQL